MSIRKTTTEHASTPQTQRQNTATPNISGTDNIDTHVRTPLPANFRLVLPASVLNNHVNAVNPQISTRNNQLRP